MKKDLLDLISLADRAGLPLIDVRDDIKSNFKDSKARARILRNLDAIQKAVQNIPRDMDRTEVSDFEYEWPHSAK
jgi:predicted secreted Zn-dependent protease